MSNYQVNLLVRGRRVEKYKNPHKLETWIEGRPGSEYQIELVNDSYSRVEMICSIDGLDIISGKPAGINSKGYIVDPRSKIIVDGWLVDSKTAAKFKFGTKQNSYSEKIGEGTDNTGVIGLQVFSEYRNPTDYDYKRYFCNPPNFPPYYPKTPWGLDRLWYGSEVTYNLSTTSSNVLRSNISKGPDISSFEHPEEVTTSLGTEFGDATEFNTKNVYFKRNGSSPVFTEILYYGTKEELNALGIVLTWQQPKTNKRANPFPADSGYCKTPEGWNG